MALHDYENIVVLTGAGISKASGLATFRQEGGNFLRPLSAEQLIANAGPLWREFTGSWWPSLLASEPNAAHRALAELERDLAPSQTLTVVTQNVDGLHQRAGSQNVLEVYGSLFRFRCHACRTKVDRAAIDFEAPEPPSCPDCAGVVRPDVVLFGESLEEAVIDRAPDASKEADLFVAIGTSALVFPAAGLAHFARARTVWINPDAPEGRLYDDWVQGPAERVVPTFFETSPESDTTR